MEEKNLAFKLSKHRTLWDAMPDYILKIVESRKPGNMW